MHASDRADVLGPLALRQLTQNRASRPSSKRRQQTRKCCARTRHAHAQCWCLGVGGGWRDEAPLGAIVADLSECRKVLGEQQRGGEVLFCFVRYIIS